MGLNSKPGNSILGIRVSTKSVRTIEEVNPFTLGLISWDKPIDPVVRIRNQHALQCIGLENLYTNLSGQQGRGDRLTDVLTRAPFTARQLEYISTAHRDNIPEGERKDMVWLAEQKQDAEEEVDAIFGEIAADPRVQRYQQLLNGPPLNVREFRRILREFPHIASSRAKITIINRGTRLRPNLECKTMFGGTVPFQTEHLAEILRSLQLDFFEFTFELPIDITPPDHILHLLPRITGPVYIYGMIPDQSRSSVKTPFTWFRDNRFNTSSLTVIIYRNYENNQHISVRQILRMPIPLMTNNENLISLQFDGMDEADQARLDAHFTDPLVIGDRNVLYR